MQIFAATDIEDRDLVLKNVNEHYAGNFFDPGRGSIFIASEGETARDVAVKIGLSKDSQPDYTSGVIVSILNYWGHFNRDLWEWINVKS